MRDLAPGIERDVLSDVLQSIRFRSTILCRSELRAPWGFAVAGREFASFHIVLAGQAFLEVEGADGQRALQAGDLVMLPHGSAHVVRDAPSTRATRLEQLVADGSVDVRGTLRNRRSGARTVLVCGGFHFEDGTNHPLLAALPRVLHVSGKSRGVATWLRTTLSFIAHESNTGGPGAETVIARLADVLFVEAIRSHLSTREARESGLAVALRDPRIGGALALLHREPEADWDVARLARRVGMSRTAFATRFVALVGESPLRYATQCRMNKAVALLRSSDATIPQIAERVGYDSDVGFSRAFRRHVGTPPAAYRLRLKRAP
jgi:AraC-like DNA-binding protein